MSFQMDLDVVAVVESMNLISLITIISKYKKINKKIMIIEEKNSLITTEANSLIISKFYTTMEGFGNGNGLLENIEGNCNYSYGFVDGSGDEFSNGICFSLFEYLS